MVVVEVERDGGDERGRSGGGRRGMSVVVVLAERWSVECWCGYFSFVAKLPSLSLSSVKGEEGGDEGAAVVVAVAVEGFVTIMATGEGDRCCCCHSCC